MPGNHDEVMRHYLGTHFGGIEVTNRDIHETADGKKLLVFKNGGLVIIDVADPEVPGDLTQFDMLHMRLYGLTANPKGCWDWWGYSGPDYLHQDGRQMRVVHAMVERLLPP